MVSRFDVEEHRDFWDYFKEPIFGSIRNYFSSSLYGPVLEALLEAEPLTPERLRKLSKFVFISAFDYNLYPKIGKASIFPFSSGNFSGGRGFYPMKLERPCYVVQIGVGGSLTDDDIKTAMVHELCHGYYRGRGPEELIERETARFIKAHPDFVERIYSCFLPFPGYCAPLDFDQPCLPMRRK